MRNRVKITKANYVVNPEKKVVVCVLECDMQLQKHPAYDDIHPNMWANLPLVSNNGTFKVRAIARCNEEDSFDEEAGKRIAESRAKGKAFATAAKVYKEIEKCFLNCAALVNESVEACEQTVKVEEAHVELLIG
jgi:hypothetical protein|nr:MAG TPA: hypothetical protein [Crassvirales sp.]